jgi:hypothetical protein
VPSWFPEKINWALSDEYHAPFVEGGHVRIYRGSELRSKISQAGLTVDATHKAHGLHSPYWWLRCAVGPQREDHKALDKALSPVIGKSYVVYATKPKSSFVGTKS